ncbi:MAG: PilZ domain-containing protein [Nitrospirae bacterium]|nr:PilZ domain-containing protein [Nitrospirota bacterium]
MNRRAHERIPANIEVKFFCGNTFYTGNVVNISENGLFINAQMAFPFDSKFELLIPSSEGVLKVPVMVTRMVKSGSYYDGMGVQLLEQPKNYLQYVQHLRSAVTSI